MKLQVMIDTGVPREMRPAQEPAVPRRPIEDQIRDSLELIESDKGSSIEWRAIRDLYDQLCCMKQSSRVQNLRKMIKPVLAKYGYFKE
jgi:hypothetical protein